MICLTESFFCQTQNYLTEKALCLCQIKSRCPFLTSIKIKPLFACHEIGITTSELLVIHVKTAYLIYFDTGNYRQLHCS